MFLIHRLRMAQDFLQHERLSKLQEEVLEELEIMELQPKSWWRAPGATVTPSLQLTVMKMTPKPWQTTETSQNN